MKAQLELMAKPDIGGKAARASNTMYDGEVCYATHCMIIDGLWACFACHSPSLYVLVNLLLYLLFLWRGDCMLFVAWRVCCGPAYFVLLVSDNIMITRGLKA